MNHSEIPYIIEKIRLSNGREIELSKDTTIEQAAKKITEALTEKKVFPQKDDQYWYITDSGIITGSITGSIWKYNQRDIYRLKRGNVYRTKKLAEIFLFVDNAIHDIVWEKNKETPVDWNDITQKKWSLDYDYKNNNPEYNDTYSWRRQGTLYCSSDFLPDLLKIVTEEDLNWYVTRKV